MGTAKYTERTEQAASGLKIDRESFRKCNLKVDAFQFIPKPEGKENGWVRLELELSTVTGENIPDEVLISLDHIIEWNEEETGDMTDLWNPNTYDMFLCGDGSNISYPLYSVVRSGTATGVIRQRIFCPEAVMRHPESYSLRARQKNPEAAFQHQVL